jgi:NhaC family Na+:H+ antiporter
MLETITLVTFAAMLITGIVYDFPLLVALIAGWLLFFDYGLLRGFDTRELWRMSTRGLSDVGPVLCLFVLIGALTASWRAAGTIPAIICWSARVIGPSTLVPASFLLCCVMSLLTGSSFASAATTGVICMAIASSMGANLMLTGGAIVSGCFFGDQCSPMSSSASLVAGITGTNLLSNVSRMMRTGAVPFACCLGLYSLLGVLLAPGADVTTDIALSGTEALRSFVLDPIVFAPIVVVFALCLLRVNVRWTIVASLVAAVTIEVFVQGMDLQEVARTLVYGYHAADPEVARLANGGGVLSMAELSAIVAVASTYAGLFEGTGLLAGLESAVTSLARHTTPLDHVTLQNTTAISDT